MIYGKKYRDFKEYEGYWKNGFPHGERGKMIYRDGAVYEGSWRDGKQDGEGKMIYGKTKSTAG